MATTTNTRLVIEFIGSSGDLSFSYTHADPEAEAADIAALAEALIENGSIFVNQPMTAKSARIVTTTSTDIDIENP